jgi:hypothetical protein
VRRRQVSRPKEVEARRCVIAIPSGETTFNFQADVPKSVPAGTYVFDFTIDVSLNDAGGFQGDGVSFLVSLDAQ